MTKAVLPNHWIPLASIKGQERGKYFINWHRGQPMLTKQAEYEMPLGEPMKPGIMTSRSHMWVKKEQ